MVVGESSSVAGALAIAYYGTQCFEKKRHADVEKIDTCSHKPSVRPGCASQAASKGKVRRGWHDEECLDPLNSFFPVPESLHDYPLEIENSARCGFSDPAFRSQVKHQCKGLPRQLSA
jgi:hypothetical protein